MKKAGSACAGIGPRKGQGGTVKMAVTRLDITGMTCERCGGRVKTALQDVRGVNDAQVDWQRGLALVQHTDDVPVGALEDAVEHAQDGTLHHYTARLAQDGWASDRTAWAVAANALLLCVPCLLALLVLVGGAGAAAAVITRVAGLSR